MEAKKNGFSFDGAATRLFTKFRHKEIKRWEIYISQVTFKQQHAK